MDHLNSLSDDELRQRLRQHGFPNLPITSTTRKVLIKKLRNHLNNEQSKLKQATSFVTRYSSDEDASDQETKRHQRATMPPPKTNAKRFSTSSPTITKISPRSQSVYVSPVVRHMHNDSEDDVEHETNNLNTAFSNSYGSSTINRSYTLGPRTASSLYPASSQSFSSAYDRSNHTGISQTREPASTSNGHSADLFTDYSQGFSTHYRRSAISTPSPRRSTQTITTSPSRTRHLNESFATTTNESDIVHQADRQTAESSVLIGTALWHFFTKLNERFSIILGLFVVFFAVVAFMYISISPVQEA